MKNIKKIAYAGAGLGLLAASNLTSFADITVDQNKGTNITRTGTLVVTIETWVQQILTLLYFVAVVYGLWGGFNILTAAGNEDKVKKGKTVLINAAIGIVVIFLVGIVIRFILGLVGGDNVNQ